MDSDSLTIERMEFFRSTFMPGEGEVYKDRQEEFVFGLKGCSLFEVVTLSLASMSGNFFFSSLKSAMKKANKWPENIFFDLVIEYLLVILPYVGCLTIFHKFNLYIAAAFIILSLPLLNFTGLALNLHGLNGKRRDFLMIFRTHVMIGTIVAILAVDFRALPRRFAKTEMYGYSLMDSGVGCFMFGAGLINKGKYHGLSPFQRAIKTTIASLPLFILGVGRFFLVTLSGYQQHLTEYGVHWNFFFTLGIVTFLSGIFNISQRYALVVGLAVISAYQVVLKVGLADIVLSEGPRTNLILQNKEGLSCSIGYFGIFLLGMAVSETYCVSKRQKRGWLGVVGWTFALWMGLVLTSVLADFFIQESSRRLVNFSYAFKNTSICIMLILFSLVIQVATDVESRYMVAVNRNQLVLFLFANFLTGIINMLIPTITLSKSAGFVVICVYIALIGLLSVGLDVMDITLKFW